MIKYRVYTATGFDEFVDLPITNNKVDVIEYSIETDEENNNYIKINLITPLING
jgi:hypothetical protein